MPVAAYMISILARQRLVLGEGFFQQHPGAWLVWEPGPWRPVTDAGGIDVRITVNPGEPMASRPPGEDAICFELPHLPGPGPLKGGRATSSDISINDVTVSREQFELVTVGQRWHLAVTRPGVSVNARQVPPGAVVPLTSGDWLTLGEVRLTYLDVDAMAERLQRAQPHLAAPEGRTAT
jgi:hypothetical protein